MKLDTEYRIMIQTHIQRLYRYSIQYTEYKIQDIGYRILDTDTGTDTDEMIKKLIF